jgi:hypothetical protein
VLWQFFEGLKGVAVLSIRGENSDLFSQATQAEMVQRHPSCESYVVVGEGHAPLLSDRATMQKISAFVNATEDRSG